MTLLENQIRLILPNLTYNSILKKMYNFTEVKNIVWSPLVGDCYDRLSTCDDLVRSAPSSCDTDPTAFKDCHNTCDFCGHNITDTSLCFGYNIQLVQT